MKNHLSIFIALSLSIFIGCSDSTEPAGTEDFLLELNIVDTENQAVEGLEAKVHVHIPEMNHWYGPLKGSGAKPSVRIGFAAPVPARTTITIYNLEGQPVRTVIDNQLLQPGMREVIFDGQTDDDERIVGTAVLRYELVAMHETTDEILFQDSQWMTLYTAIDYDQRPLLGFTDATGRVETKDKLLFSFLYDLPDLIGYDENGQNIGTFTIPDLISVTVTDTLASLHQSFDISIEPGPQQYKLVWDPIDPKKVGPVPSELKTASSNLVFLQNPDPLEWELWPAYPNPFN